MGDITLEINPRPQFLGYLQRKERYAVLVCHRRAGKSFCCVQDIGARALTHRRDNMDTAPLRYAYIAPTRDQAKDIAWGYAKDFFSAMRGVKINESDLKITLPKRQEIRLYSGENYERMRGLYFDGVILDEYADIDPDAWSTVIRPCLSDYGGWATFMGTPKGKNAFYSLWKSASKDGTWFSMMLRASESGILNEEELRDIQNDPNITRNQYLQEYECDFDVGTPGSIFLDDVVDAKKGGRISGDIMHYAGVPVYTVFDIGLPANTKCWVFQCVGDKVKFLQALTGHRELNTPSKWCDFLGQLARERGYSYGCHFLPHDGETVWMPSFKEAGLTNVECLPKPKDEWDPINLAKRMFNRIWINESECDSGIRALEAWSSRQVSKKTYYTNKPEHNWASHWCTAFSYAPLAIETGRCVNRAGQTRRSMRGGIRVRKGHGSKSIQSGFRGRVIK